MISDEKDSINENPIDSDTDQYLSVEKQFEARLGRILRAVHAKSDTDLARFLEISQQSISNARAKKQLPMKWILTISEKLGVSVDWLLFGRGPMIYFDRHGRVPTLSELFGSVEQLIDEMAEFAEPILKKERISFKKKLAIILFNYEWAKLNRMLMEYKEKSEPPESSKVDT